jgi:hypothetical protein
MKFRVIPPSTGGSQIVEGRLYEASPGEFLDVSQVVAQALAANGWSITSSSHGGTGVHGNVGVTGERPFNPFRGQWFLDAQIGKHIVFDGHDWRDAVSAAAV